jgi:hypothetical protein
MTNDTESEHSVIVQDEAGMYEELSLEELANQSGSDADAAAALAVAGDTANTPPDVRGYAVGTTKASPDVSSSALARDVPTSAVPALTMWGAIGMPTALLAAGILMLRRPRPPKD